jgi:hypothetical protein
VPRSQAKKSATKPRAGGTRTKKTASRKPASILLPVLVVDETLLLPHMSIPFPIEDEETARVVDRASRSELRHVLVLTERPVFPEQHTGATNGAVDDDGDLRALLADAISEAVALGDIDGEPEWIPDPEPEPQEYELCGVASSPRSPSSARPAAATSSCKVSPAASSLSWCNKSRILSPASCVTTIQSTPPPRRKPP